MNKSTDINELPRKFQRTSLIFGKDACLSLSKKKIAIFGLGGVGGYVAEGLVRAGVENFHIIDKDIVDESNINRQIIALDSTIGIPKVDLVKSRILSINSRCNVSTSQIFFNQETLSDFDFSSYDYVVDAIDTIASKILIISTCKQLGVPIISSMGTGNKVHPELFTVSDIYKTYNCALSKVIRRELREKNIKNLKVVFSPELPIPNHIQEDLSTDVQLNNNKVIGSVSFVPPVSGFIIAGEVIKDLIKFP